jgi:hypothetical protein
VGVLTRSFRSRDCAAIGYSAASPAGGVAGAIRPDAPYKMPDRSGLHESVDMVGVRAGGDQGKEPQKIMAPILETRGPLQRVAVAGNRLGLYVLIQHSALTDPFISNAELSFGHPARGPLAVAREGRNIFSPGCHSRQLNSVPCVRPTWNGCAEQCGPA